MQKNIQKGAIIANFKKIGQDFSAISTPGPTSQNLCRTSDFPLFTTN